MQQFVSAVNPSNISPTYRTQCTQYMQAHTVRIGSTKRPLAPVLLAIGSVKLTNVPRLLRMDTYASIRNSSYSLKHQSYAQETLRTVYAPHTACMGSTKRPLAHVLPAIGSETLTNMPRLLRMDICINSYQQLTPQTSVLRSGPNAHSIYRPLLDETASRP